MTETTNMRGPIVKAHELQQHDIIDLQAVFEENGQGNEVTSQMEFEFASVDFISIEGHEEVLISTNQGNVTVPFDFTLELY